MVGLGISEPSTVVIPTAFLLLSPHLLGGFIHIFVNSLVASTSTKGTRGTALVVAPEISSGFIWGGLMHGADWLPTIVEGAAGIRTTGWVNKKPVGCAIFAFWFWELNKN